METQDGLGQGGVPGCPKRMVFGPCGGVREDLTCEMAPHPCVFVDEPAVAWDLPPAAEAHVPAPPRVLTDLTVRPYDVDSVRDVVGALAGSCDAVLVGEHQNRPDFPPSLMAALVGDSGGRAWITLTCRDRNRVVLEQEAHGLRVADAAGVLCVTGDGRAHGTRPGVTQVFDVDSTRLTSLLSASGLPLAVAEAPSAPPQELRPHRVLAKQRAGASLCLLNHVGSPAGVAAFVAACRAVGVTIPFVAGVAVYTDERSARVLQAFPGLHLDGVQVQRVLDAPDPVTAGIAAAVAEARALLEVDGVEGVNLSGLASDRGERYAAEVKAEVGRALQEVAA
ncbi:MAG: Methylenetetrahydrofolate reductase [Frankiales bacterium]|nr:Methylenetetrahydrofolate reductase [Frankiales bacterium]